MKTATAIETSYRNYRMRSRLEARWAVFFDSLGLEWHYEPQGYANKALAYLPDFFLPKLDYFVEIKPTMPEADEQAKASMLAEATHKPVFILYGDIPADDEWSNDSAHITIPCAAGGVVSDTRYRWTQCPSCGAIGMAWEGRVERLSVCGCNTLGIGDWTPDLQTAYRAARSARFEHGETPAQAFARDIETRAFARVGGLERR